MSEFEIRDIDGKYYLYCADEEVLSPEGGSISTTSEELANLLLKDAEEFGADCENPLSILSYHALYCDLLQQDEDEAVNQIHEFDQNPRQMGAAQNACQLARRGGQGQKVHGADRAERLERQSERKPEGRAGDADRKPR